MLMPKPDKNTGVKNYRAIFLISIKIIKPNQVAHTKGHYHQTEAPCAHHLWHNVPHSEALRQ